MPLTYLANLSFPAARIALNAALNGIDTWNAGASAPTNYQAFTPWLDTSGATPILKIRNAANTAWVNVLAYNGADASLAPWYINESNMASNSATRVPSQQSVKSFVETGYRLTGRRTLTSGTAATFTPTAGTRYLRVQIIGATGGGGGVDGQGAGTYAIGGAGGNGGFTEKTFVVGSQTFTYTIGARGNGGTAGANNGTAGGTTSFTASSDGTIQVTGGGGGDGTLAVATGRVAQKAGGVGSGGDINYRGNQCLSGRWNAGTGFVDSNNGAPLFGGGITEGSGSQAGTASSSYGAGGTGAQVTSADTANYAGGNGIAGVIYVEEFC